MSQVWVDAPENDAVLRPACGGLFADEAGKVIAWSGFDPDQQVLCYSWKEDDKTWLVNQAFFDEHRLWTKKKGPVHVGQFREQGVKEQAKTKERCSTFQGTKFKSLIAKENEVAMSLETFKEQLRRHMIINGMLDVFKMPDPNDPNIKYDLFRNHARFTLDQMSGHHLRRQVGSLVDGYELQNLQNSGDYIRESIGTDLLYQIQQEVGMDANGPITFVALMRILYSDGCDSIEE